MENNSINTQFINVLQSLGYSQDESKTLSKSSDISRKIQTITSIYNFNERKMKIIECLDELKSRNSLINLLFLRFTFETMNGKIDEMCHCFIKHEGVSILEYCFNSNNEDFLNNLMELVIFIHKENGGFYNFLSKILKKYTLIDKKLIIIFLNLKIDKNPLLNEPNIFKNVVLEICKLDKIKNEFNFLLDLNLDLIKEEILKNEIKEKFEDEREYYLLYSKINVDKTGAVNKTAAMNRMDTDKNDAVNRMDTDKNDAVNRMDTDKNDAVNRMNTVKMLDAEKRFNSNINESKNQLHPNKSYLNPCEKVKLKYTADLPSNNSVSFIDKQNDSHLKELEKEIENLKIENHSLKGKLTKLLNENNQKIKFTKNILNKNVDCSNKNDTIESCNSGESVNNIGFKGTGLFGKKSGGIFSTLKASSASKPESETGSSKLGGIFSSLKASPESKPESSKLESLESSNPVQKSNNIASKFGIKKSIKNPTLISEKSYIGLKWKKSSKLQSKIFSNMNYEEYEKLFNISEFDKFILKNERISLNNIKSIPNSTAQNTMQSTIIDPKKSYALNIALGRIKLSNSELVSQISNGEFENENLVRQLIMYFPTNEEYNLIKESKSELGRAEQLIRSISDIERFHSSLLSLRFNFVFKNRDYFSIIKKMISFFKKLIESVELRNLFGILLVIGNVLNLNTFNGNAEGFSLDSLVHFNNKEIIEMIKSKINISKLILELNINEKKSFDSFEINIDTLINEMNEIRSLFGNFLTDKIKNEYFLINEKYEELLEIYKESQKYFGENDERFIFKIESFLKPLIE